MREPKDYLFYLLLVIEYEPLSPLRDIEYTVGEFVFIPQGRSKADELVYIGKLLH